jgi:hypothetical protein
MKRKALIASFFLTANLTGGVAFAQATQPAAQAVVPAAPAAAPAGQAVAPSPQYQFSPRRPQETDQQYSERQARRMRRFGQNGGANSIYNSFQPAATQADSTPTPPTISGSYTLLTERSIFSRTPLMDPNPPDQGPRINQEDILVFVGVMETVGDKNDKLIAFLEDSNSQETAPVKVGDAVAGGKVTGITLDQMDFLEHGITQHLQVGQNLAGAQVFGAMPATTLPSNLDFSGAHGDILKAMALRRLKELQGVSGK